MKRSILLVLILTIIFGIVGCGKRATSLHITNAPTAGLLIGETVTLGISGVSSQRNIAWESMNVQIATVNPQGQVTGIAPGAVIIKATDVLSQAEDSITINVISNTLESITIKNARSVEMNKTLVLDIQATPTGASKAVEWLSSNPSVASVSSTGVVTGIKIGKATITAISKIDSSISTAVEISVVTPTADGGITVTIFGSESMSVGETQNLIAILNPSSTGGGVKWSTSNASVATVNQSDGRLLAIAPGVANITATYNTTDEVKPFDVITVTVTPAGSSGITITIVGPTSMVVGGQSTLVADVRNGGGGVSWSSSNSSIATVDSNGVVTALQSGTVVITATSIQDTNVKKTHNISISGNTIAPTSISLSGGNSLDVYQSLTLTISFTPSNASTSVTWSSSNTSIATVNSSGRVSAVGVGTATITATSTLNTNVKGQITITVSPSTGSTPESITIIGPDKVGVNQTVTWTISTDPAGANQGVVWGSDTPEVASVNNGVITGHSKGSVRIYCYSILDNNVLNAMIIDVYDVDSDGNLIIDHSN